MPKGVYQRKRRLKCQHNQHALVRWMFDEIDAQMAIDGELTVKGIVERAGVSDTSLANWAKGVQPSLAMVDNVLGVLGYQLSVKEREE